MKEMKMKKIKVNLIDLMLQEGDCLLWYSYFDYQNKRSTHPCPMMLAYPKMPCPKDQIVPELVEEVQG